MSQPVLFVIDDDAGVVRALRDDLKRRFGEDFRIIGESSAAVGLTVLRELAGRREPVALLIVDHDMSEMPGVGFLARAHEMHPLAKRVLLVERDYSACSLVVRAMTLGEADLSSSCALSNQGERGSHPDEWLGSGTPGSAPSQLRRAAQHFLQLGADIRNMLQLLGNGMCRIEVAGQALRLVAGLSRPAQHEQTPTQ